MRLTGAKQPGTQAEAESKAAVRVERFVGRFGYYHVSIGQCSATSLLREYECSSGTSPDLPASGT